MEQKYTFHVIGEEIPIEKVKFAAQFIGIDIMPSLTLRCDGEKLSALKDLLAQNKIEYAKLKTTTLSVKGGI